MNIRAYRKEDYASVVDLVTTVLAEFGFSAHIGGVQKDLETIDDGYGHAKAGFWVAELDGKVVGTVAIRAKHELTCPPRIRSVGPGMSPREAATCELKRLYVSKDARGHGLGRALYAHAEKFARDAGYDRIWLDSSRKFVDARRLYEKNGFVLLEELANDWCDNVYEKRLK